MKDYGSKIIYALTIEKLSEEQTIFGISLFENLKY